jgi:AcrR family transcriptional regulator
MVGPASQKRLGKQSGKRSSTRRRLPKQPRSQVTCDSLLEAAERLLDKEGPAALTTRRVAEVAGVSVGSLYQYFKDKDAIVAALTERYLGRELALFADAFETAAPAASIEDAVAGFVQATRGSHRHERRILAALYEKLPVTAYHRALFAYLPYLVRRLEQHAGEVKVARLDLAALLLLHAGDGLMRALYVDSPAQADAELLVREFVRMIAGYLRGVS